MSALGAWSISFGCAIGWGAFVVPGTAFLPGAGPVGTIIGMAIGVFALAFVAWNYRFMMERAGSAGGSFAFAKTAFGNDHGFIAAWFLVLTYLAILWANVTAIALVVRHFLGSSLHFGFSYSLFGFDVHFGEAAFCSAAVLLAGAICLARRRVAVASLVFLAVMAAGGVAATFAATLLAGGPALHSVSPKFASGASIVRQIASIIALVPWAFVGFEAVSHFSGRFKFPVRKSFPVMALALAAGAVVYVLMTLLPVIAPGGFSDWTLFIAEEAAMGHVPTATAAEHALGAPGSCLILVSVTGAIGTTLVGNTLVISHILRAMSEDGILPRPLSSLNRHGRPAKAIVLVSLASAAVPFLGRSIISAIVDVNTIGATIAYCYASAATVKFALAEHRRAAAASGLFGLAVSAAFLIVLLVPNFFEGSLLSTESYLLLSLWGLAGFAYFRHVFVRDRENRFGHSSFVWAALLSLVFATSSAWQYEASLKGMVRAGSLAQFCLVSVSIALMLDIYSILRRREKEMERRKTEAEETNKAKNAFLANVSHDMRTPLNAIIGFASIARKRTDMTADEWRGYAAKIEDAGNGLVRFVDTILDLRKIEAGKFKLSPAPCDLPSLVCSIRDMFAAEAARKKITFSAETSGLAFPVAICDETLLRRLASNLAGNAIKYTPEGGRVSMLLSETPLPAAGRAKYTLSVRDNGIGMDPEFAKRVFEPFERERPTMVSGIEGTGLGMAIAKSIVNLMGGEITLQTAKGKGSTFTAAFTFPVVQEQHEPEPSLRRLLVADDNEINREIVREILRVHDVDCEEASDGKKAVEAISRAGAGYFDAVLMDIQMPVMDGYAALRAIRALGDPALAATPVVALSANPVDAQSADGDDGSFDACATKPVQYDKLMQAIRLAASRRRKEQ